MNRAEAGALGAKASAESRRLLALQVREAYEAVPKRCRHCTKPLDFDRRRNDFCGHSCSASHGNVGNNKHAKRHVPRNCPCGDLPRRNNKYCDTCLAKGVHFHRAPSLESCRDDGTRRSYLLRTRPRQCQQCLGTEWLGQPIPLEMDHIDGDSGNNVGGNLRLVCPNCHAQSPWSKGRNRGRGREKRQQTRERQRAQRKISNDPVT